METKIKQINLICAEALKHFTGKNCPDKLIITGQEGIPMQTQRRDMQTSHEEGDVIIPQVNIAMKEGQRQIIKVISDDTDVYVLLMYYCVQEGWRDDIYMESLEERSTMISIKKTIEGHKSIIPWLPAMHLYQDAILDQQWLV